MPARSLLVEERLRVVLVYLDALKRFAILMDTPVHPRQFERLDDFARWVARMADATTAHVAAVRSALPASCTNIDAPFVNGGVR